MNEKQVYQIYANIMKIHKKFIGEIPDHDHLTAIVAAINALNSVNNSNFCNAMTDVLRRWFINGFVGVEPTGITLFYTDLWRLHKRYMGQDRNDDLWEAVVGEIGELNKKYVFRSFQEYALAIADELENGGRITVGGAIRQETGAERDSEAIGQKADSGMNDKTVRHEANSKTGNEVVGYGQKEEARQ